VNTQVIVRIDPEVKEKVSNLAKNEGKNISEIVRELLDGYIKNRDIGGYIDDLWKRIGAKIGQTGIGLSEIDSVISQIRTQKK
jgi:predicted DNA-binding protein